MISTSEIKTSVIIDEMYLELAVRVLHRDFELNKEPSADPALRRSDTHHRRMGGVNRYPSDRLFRVRLGPGIPLVRANTLSFSTFATCVAEIPSDPC